MPARNSIKKYIQNGYYHIYNRGVEKRIIFEDDQDYAVFLSYIKNYLTPKNVNLLQKELSEITDYAQKSEILNEIKLNNFADEIKLLAYCLMPNHFHFLIKQSSPNSIDYFINSLNTRYVMYFNKKYQRVGPLFQGVYKAVLIENDNQLLHLSAYIHKNPMKFSPKSRQNSIEPLLKRPSSLSNYLGITNTSWVDTKTILSFFSKTNTKNSYKNFIAKTTREDISISNLIIE
jgi:putative transposase